jgi:hypothetical protein
LLVRVASYSWRLKEEEIYEECDLTTITELIANAICSVIVASYTDCYVQQATSSNPSYKQQQRSW